MKKLVVLFFLLPSMTLVFAARSGDVLQIQNDTIKQKRIYKTAEISALPDDTVKVIAPYNSNIPPLPKAPVPNTCAGRLPELTKHGKNDFLMNCGPYKPKRKYKPLIILDGQKITYKQLQKINVNTIETISILKDSAAIAPYGRKGRNGVLVVNTRKK